MLSTDECRRLRRQIRRPVLQRFQRRELNRQALHLKLIQPLWFGEVLEPMLAQITQAKALVEQCARRL